MKNARQGFECIVNVKNDSGTGAKVMDQVSKQAINVLGVVGYATNGEAAIHIAVEDDSQLTNSLRAGGFDFKTNTVILLDVTNEPGAAAKIMHKLAEANISVQHLYATALGSGDSVIVLRTSNDEAAINALSGDK